MTGLVGTTAEVATLVGKAKTNIAIQINRRNIQINAFTELNNFVGADWNRL